MARNVLIDLAFGLAVVSGATALVASNMGFKLNYTLNQVQAGVSLSGSSTLALPENRQAGRYRSLATNAKELMDDIGLASVANVPRFIEATDGLESYTGRKTGSLPVPFPLTPGEAYFVRMKTTVNYIPAHY